MAHGDSTENEYDIYIFSSFELANTFCFRTFFSAEKGMSCVFCFIIFSFEKLSSFLYSFSILEESSV